MTQPQKSSTSDSNDQQPPPPPASPDLLEAYRRLRAQPRRFQRAVRMTLLIGGAIAIVASSVMVWSYAICAFFLGLTFLLMSQMLAVEIAIRETAQPHDRD